MKVRRELIKWLFKFGLGSALIYYVLHSKMIDFHLVQSMLANPRNLWLFLSFQAFSVLCCGMRWFLLVRIQGISISLKKILELTMIGNFFNTFMPGSVGGDIIKGWYVAGHEPQRKTIAVFTVLLDRVIGLAVIIFYSATILLFYTQWLAGSPQLHAVAYSIWTFTAVCLVFAFVFYAPGAWERTGIPKLMEATRGFHRVHRVLEAALLYRHHFTTVFFAVVLSALSVCGIIFFYKLQGDVVGINLEVARYFFVVPLAMTASAIPILPGGLGVGQVAFVTLFQWVGVSNPQQGATLCTVMQAYTLVFNCIGAVFYFKYKHKPQEADPIQAEKALNVPGGHFSPMI